MGSTKLDDWQLGDDIARSKEVFQSSREIFCQLVCLIFWASTKIEQGITKILQGVSTVAEEVKNNGLYMLKQWSRMGMWLVRWCKIRKSCGIWYWGTYTLVREA